MANQLKMAAVYTVYTLLEQGWSQRRIARELGIDLCDGVGDQWEWTWGCDRYFP